MTRKKSSLPGTIFLNKSQRPGSKGRYWWKVRLPGEKKRRSIPLKWPGQRYATRSKKEAAEIAADIYRRAQEDGGDSRTIDAQASSRDALCLFLQTLRDEGLRTDVWLAELEYRIQSLQEELPDKDLDCLGWDEINAVCVGVQRRVKSGQWAVSTALNHMATFLQALTWLENTRSLYWVGPRGWRKQLSDARRRIKAVGRRHQRMQAPEQKALELGQLGLLWKHADDLERLWILLALNCGWTQIDISTMDVAMLEKDAGEWAVSRPRHKTGVWARWPLWRLTAERLAPWIEDVAPGEPVFLTRQGKRWVHLGSSGRRVDAWQQRWTRLLKRCGLVQRKTWVETDSKTGRKRRRSKTIQSAGVQWSFNSLRDTGSTWIEQIDPRVTEMYLAHAESGIKKHYVDRDWKRLSIAVRKIEEKASRFAG